MPHIIDLQGQRFGRWEVECINKSKIGKGSFWICKCICGTTRSISSWTLRCGDSKSCGCLHKETVKQPRLPKGEAERRRTLAVYKYCAKKRGYNWAISDIEALDIMSKNCHYCNALPANVSKPLAGGRGLAFVYNGIDRVDNSVGYIKSNILPCCRACNVAKGERSYTEFLIWIRAVHNRLCQPKVAHV